MKQLPERTGKRDMAEGEGEKISGNPAELLCRLVDGSRGHAKPSICTRVKRNGWVKIKVTPFSTYPR